MSSISWNMYPYCPLDDVILRTRQKECNNVNNNNNNDADDDVMMMMTMIMTLIRNKIDDHSDVVGASPLGAAPTTSSHLT